MTYGQTVKVARATRPFHGWSLLRKPVCRKFNRLCRLNGAPKLPDSKAIEGQPLKVARKKRPFCGWWSLTKKPVCHKCKRICRVKGTLKLAGGLRIQKRYCPSCNEPLYTSYVAE